MERWEKLHGKRMDHEERTYVSTAEPSANIKAVLQCLNSTFEPCHALDEKKKLVRFIVVQNLLKKHTV
jgi:hypothetical protein